MSAQKVSVFGLGYVGCVSAACLANLGHQVTGIDRDEYKVGRVRAGEAPFYEPGLAEIVRSTVAAGRLRATTSVSEGIADAGIALVCVGTPSERNGNLGLEQLRRVTEEIASALDREQELVVAVRSTVFPGTCEEVVAPPLANFPNVRVVNNPEFLREGSAIRDFLEPSLVVVGGEDPGAVRLAAALYEGLGAEACLVSLRTAEMIKYACNAYHAVKISFANEIGALSEAMGVRGNEVMDTLCRDAKLNTSAAYLKPGFAFGGSCLPKDLRALAYRARREGLSLPFLESVLPANQAHLDRALQRVLDLPEGRIGVYGLAFKENTDDLRESPVVTLLETLIGKGRELQVFDPHIRIDEIYGSNRQFALSAIPHISKLVAPSLDHLLQWANHLVIAQNPAPQIAGQLKRSGLPVVNLVGE
jgi:GDP-mannose 6-dehydrogenase